MRRAALLALCLVAASACRTLPAGPSAVPGVPLAADDPRPQRLVAEWNERAAERQGLRGRAFLSVDSGGGALHLRSRPVLALERPSRLRVEILGLLDAAVAVLVTDGARFELFRAEDRSYQTGEVHPRLLWEQAYLDLTPEEAIELLLGAPLLDRTLSPRAADETAAGELRFDLADDLGVVRERVEFDAQGRLRRLEERDPEGALEWEARFDDYRDLAAAPFAHALSLRVAAGQSEASIQLSEVELDPELPEALFELRPAPEVGAP